jgi:hypothetical protein
MKIRMGFVSNSSTSSFCIYGVYLSDEEAKNIKGTDDYEFWEEKAGDLGLEHHHPDGFDGHYIGMDWSNIKGSETGNQFKKRVQKLITELIGFKMSCGTCKEAYYD